MKAPRVGLLSVALLTAVTLVVSSGHVRGGRGSGGSRGPGGGGRSQPQAQRRGGGAGGQGGATRRGGVGFQQAPRAGRGGSRSPGRMGGAPQYQNQYRYEHQYQRRGPSEGRERRRHEGESGLHRWGYDRASETSLSGTVVEGPAQGQGEGLGNTLRVRTADGEESRLHLGPPWYREALGIEPQPGDHVEAVGASGAEPGQGQIMAREFNWNGHTYRFRNEEGIPLWAGAGRSEWGRYAATRGGPDAELIAGEVEGIEAVSPGGDDMGRGVVVRLRVRERLRNREGEQAQASQEPGAQVRERERTRETARVHLGPYWFVEETAPGLRMGEQIAVTGRTAEWSGENVLIASEMERNQERLRFRNRHGRPEWSGSWQNWDGWGPGARYGQIYDPGRVRAVAGEVELVEEGIPMVGMGRGVMLNVRTQDRERIRAHIGPVWLSEQLDLALEPGDQLALTGSLVEMNGKQVMMVSDLSVGGRQVRLRERDGTPVWAGRLPDAAATAEAAP